MHGDRQACPAQVWDGAQRRSLQEGRTAIHTPRRSRSREQHERNLASTRTKGKEETAGRASKSAVTGWAASDVCAMFRPRGPGDNPQDPGQRIQPRGTQQEDVFRHKGTQGAGICS